MIKVGDIYRIKDLGHGPSSLVESIGMMAKITIADTGLCWIRILEGPWLGLEVPCLVSRLEKYEAEA